ncbi:MAG: hypothetical protein H2069_10385 [Legionella sp.]|nr:hypothetical protein [Legionella sp.]
MSYTGLNSMNLDSAFLNKMKRYMILKTLFWPFYFIVEKSPLERLSEIFFRHYGNEGVTYLGTRGIRNFLNDLLKGKN